MPGRADYSVHPVTYFHGRGEFGQDLAFDAAGRIVAAGYTANGSDTEFALMRADS